MKPNDIQGKTILIASLNWGFGHVSRCIDIIGQLNKNNKVIVAASPNQKEIFQQYFSALQFEKLIDYPFTFKGKGNFAWDLVNNSFKLNKTRKKEEVLCDHLVKKYKVDIVISDHRFGFKSKHCTSIFLTHQTKLALPFPLSLSNRYFQYLINKFDKIWLVDDMKIRLSGSLAKNINSDKCIYIGLLSRFRIVECSPQNKIYNTLLISGPEEYWEQLLNHFKKEEIDYVLGPEKLRNRIERFKKSIFLSTNNWVGADKIILNSKKIFSYCGYSTLMDTHFLNCEIDCIPCPGQYEQIYLSKKMPLTGHLKDR